MPSARERRLLLALAGLAPVLVAVVLLAGITPDLLLAAPLLVLVVPLLAGRYVGEERLLRLAAARRPRRARLRPAPVRATGRAVVVPRGGRLLAFALAVRPPPRAATAHR
jgi:hypothetical protein